VDGADNQRTQGEVHQHVHPKVSGDNSRLFTVYGFREMEMGHGHGGVDRTFKKSLCLELDM